MAHKCSKCDRYTPSQYTMCYNCWRSEEERKAWAVYDAKTPEQRDQELEEYYASECVMCGKEGAYPQKDGKNYCLHCWMVWNS